MGLSNLGHALILNNLAIEIPDTVADVEALATTLTKIGFKVKQYTDINFQVTCSLDYLSEKVSSLIGYPFDRKEKTLDLRLVYAHALIM